MEGIVIEPPNYPEISGPLVFLAGPIQGALWQPEAITLIQKAAPKLHIASPRRNYLPGEFVYEAQVDWETNFLRKASKIGAILFWLAKEAYHQCDRCYAQTTRFELGESNSPSGDLQDDALLA